MSKKNTVWVVGLLLLVLAIGSAPIAVSQMEQTPLIYTYVSQFQIPRANWAAYAEDTEKTFVPVVQKLAADGTIVGWSTFEQVVHTPDGYTHGASWSSTSISGLMKVLDEIRKSSPRPSQVAATRHEDLVMQTAFYHGVAGGGSTGYFRVLCANVKTDKPNEYVAVLKRFLVPTFEDQLKKGSATYYGVDEQYVNTGAPSTRCLVINYPNAEGMDKWAAAVNATLGKMTPAEREELNNATVADSRRDILARTTNSGHK